MTHDAEVRQSFRLKKIQSDSQSEMKYQLTLHFMLHFMGHFHARSVKVFAKHENLAFTQASH